MKSIAQNIIKLDSFFKKNEKLLFISAIILIALRFLWLNYINWHTGEISNGLHGVKYWLDTDRYLWGAESILDGSGLEGRQFQFIGYILIIALTKLLSLPDISIIIIQLGLSVFAAYALYDTVKLISKSKSAGIFALALFMCNPFIVKWHLYILTESVYTSMLIIFLWRLINMIQIRKVSNYIWVIISLIITMSVRPNGWILLPVFAGFFIYSFSFNKTLKFGLTVSCLIAFIIVLGGANSLRDSVQITTPVQNLQEGITVWGHPELNLDMPKESGIDNTKWTGGLEYVAKHPLASIKLGATRIWYTIIHVRPYHSQLYKIRVLFWIIPAYILAIISLLQIKKKPEVFASLSIILAHYIVIALSYAEHDSRFEIYILPIFYVLAGLGFALIFKHIKNRLLNSN